MSELAKIKSGCEACTVPCTTFVAEATTIPGFNLVSDQFALPMLIAKLESPLQTHGIVERVRNRLEDRRVMKVIGGMMIGLPECAGPINGQCPFESGVAELNTNIEHFAEVMAPLLPNLIKPLR